MRGVRYCEQVNDTIIRHSVDQVGNDLTAVLYWCETHVEPVWVYGDGSHTCPHLRIVGWDPDGHEVVSWPWGNT